MDSNPQVKWYLKTSTLIVLFLSIGPFALPLLWLNPRFSKRNKVIITVIVIMATIMLGIAVVNSIKSLSNYYQELSTGIL
ncbi:MAG: hypothetical protein C4540_06065 [Candidatus Omnitrophota bacterium]|nr:MAG: hypothetical protein C4540_06065 [Candidatus Omnitrophota bacterium]